MAFAAIAGSRWQGQAELWLDPLGNEAQVSPCAFEVAADTVRYTWAFQGSSHQGSIVLGGEGGGVAEQRDGLAEPGGDEADLGVAHVAAGEGVMPSFGVSSGVGLGDGVGT